MLTRRRLLALATTSAACAKVPVVVPLVPPQQPIRLGWRWLPGQTQSFTTTVVRTLGPVRTTRVETWRYTATDLDVSGVLWLSGQLTALGTRVEADDQAVDASRLEAGQAALRDTVERSVEVALRISGRLVSCSAQGFGNALPHRLLDVHLPVDPVAAGDAWEDVGLARTFAPAVATADRLTMTGEATLDEVVAHGAGWRARLQHHTQLDASALGPTMLVVGHSMWDTDPGRLATRRLQARWLPDSTQPAPVGILDIGWSHTAE